MSSDAEQIATRLAALRAEMARLGMEALIVPRADEYLGEYIPEHNERLRWLSGFSGSAGIAVVLRDSAAIFVDGRYTVQVREQVSAAHFAFHHLIEEPPVEWLARQLGRGERAGYDPRMHTLAWRKKATSILNARGIELHALEHNLVDRCWQQRPRARFAKASLHPMEYSGRSSSDKRHAIGEEIARLDADAALIFAADSAAWLLNIRGNDVTHLPLVLGFAVLQANGEMWFFADPRKIPEDFPAHAGDGVSVHAEEKAVDMFALLRGRRVLLDPDTTNAWSALALEHAGAELVEASDPVLLPKACKNAVELQGMQQAHRRDAVAMVRFLAWLDAELAAGTLHDEAVLAARLLQFRSEHPMFREPSFDTISAAAGNAAMCHYRHSDASPGRLAMHSVYLVDSGAQYPDGTTDITRTVAIGDPGEEIRRMFTLVLKGHIALDRARFPEGTTGSQLDVLARQFLWQEGFDYDHGTGHGVGSFLSVHEGPQRISKTCSSTALKPGMVLSNEPGYYRDGCYGMRCENLLVVKEFDDHEGAEKRMLGFEALTLVPFDHRLVDSRLLQGHERDWLRRYHARVWREIGPLLEQESDREWLRGSTSAWS